MCNVLQPLLSYTLTVTGYAFCTVNANV